jgi:hypothetical protein
MHRGTMRVALLALLFVASPLLAGAQITTGTVTGSVRDGQGGVIPGATVVLVSDSRGTRVAETVTSTSGDFVFPNVPGDTYVLQVTLEGFKTLRRGDISVSPGDRVVVPALTVEVGGLDETIEVRAEAPLIQAQSGERSFTVTTDAVQNLPVSTNRNFANLTALTPGVSGTNRLGGGGQNNIMMDGVSTMDTGNNGQMLQMNVEAIAEVKVLTSGYQAEYGRSSGLQISAVTKSGTNRYRGSVYDVIRNSDWNSNSWVNQMNGDPKPTAKEQDWGYSIGGPIGRPGGNNKLFFFYSHEYRPRTSGGEINRFRVPTLLERQGDFSQSRDNNGNLFNRIRDYTTGLPCTATNAAGCFQAGGVLGRIPAQRLYQTGLNVLKMWPAPNAEGINYNFEVARPIVDNLTQQPAIRIDYQPSSAWRFTSKYAGQRQRVFLNPAGVGSAAIPGFNDTLNKHPFIHAFSTTANYNINSTTFVEATYGWTQNRLAGGGSQLIMTEASNRNNIGLGQFPLLFPDAGEVDPRYYAYGTLEDYATPYFVNGEILLPPSFNWGNRIANAPPNLGFVGFLNINRTQDVSVSLTKVMGRHTAKAGFYLNHSYKAQNLGAGGGVSFTGLVNFGNDTSNPLDSGFGYANAALGIFSSYAQQSKFVEGSYIYNNVEGYIQDNWKVSQKLTLDYGLRFTHQQPQYDQFGQGSNFFPERWDPAHAPLLYVAGCPGNTTPCATSARQARNPATGQLLGANSAFAIGQLVPNSGDPLNGVVQAGQGIAQGNYEWPALAVAPRAGFAYDISGAQRLIIRGGAGLFFDRPNGNSVFAQVGNPPFSTATTVRYAQLQNLGSAGLTTSGPPRLVIFKYDSKLPSSLQWNAGVQMTLPWSSTLDMSYVGQHGYNLLQNVDINAADFGVGYLAQNQDPTLQASTVPGARSLSPDLLRSYRGYGEILQNWGIGSSTFHSIQTSANRRFRNGVQFGVNYTLGLSDRGNAGVPVRLQHNADGSFGIRDDQAEADELLGMQNLRRHTFKANFVWDMPNLPADSLGSRIAGFALNDWQLSGIYTAGSGSRYDVSYSYQSNGSNVNLTGSPNYGARVRILDETGRGCSGNQYAQFTTNAFAGPLPGSVGLESGRNYLVGCPDNILDLAVARNIRLGGSRQIQLRVDIFNALDTVIYSGRVTQLQLNSPTDPTVRNAQFLANGEINPARLTPRTAGFGAATGAQGLRSIQLQLRLQF